MIVTKKENGIHPRELDTARFWVKQELEGKHLPFLPEHVDRRLFFEGRTAWSYKYSDLHVDQRKASKTITFNIVALLKKEFHSFAEQHRFIFCATCIYYPATRKLKVAKIKVIEHDQGS